ncbi:uncharacterized protein BX663DRAFT_520998 [Cokeromyces recurvatus]|uniref:uncharacterized protein n=1 Tax=Cokeromyces recurvatus TaxID=90255 RepID=UPI00221F0EEA|nr:uncharacterized protein BX663DRAFT_520998 [Cokeromyces recurvatus]KAI7899466.1 hypothetical protein BX663DRAFT_520998 [Cokeromyces recurvatus]
MLCLLGYCLIFNTLLLTRSGTVCLKLLFGKDVFFYLVILTSFSLSLLNSSSFLNNLAKRRSDLYSFGQLVSSHLLFT